MSAVAVIHSLRADSRSTTVQNVLAHSRYLPVSEVTYINCFGIIPKEAHFDAVILTYDFLWLRTWPIWNILVERIRPLLESASIRVAMPQDDYLHCDRLDSFICQNGISHVYTPITNDLEVLYPRASAKPIVFAHALTGYVDESQFERVRQYSRPFSDREWDLGQRIRLLDPQLGSAARRKGEIAVAFSQHAFRAGFICNVSTNPNDVFLGDDWYRFLGNTRFTVGAKGGASATDPKGRMTDQVRRMRLREPEISGESIQKKLRKGRSRPGNFTAISPRIFESAAMGTCQILRHDEYFDGFEPWEHYVPIDDNMSENSAVFDVMRDHEHASAIVSASQDFLLSSNKFTYRKFLRELASDLGITCTDSETRVMDSSHVLESAVGPQGQYLSQLQSYLISCLAKGYLTNLNHQIDSRLFSRFVSQSENWAEHIADCPESLLRWIDEFREGHLILESLVVPWRTASSFFFET